MSEQGQFVDNLMAHMESELDKAMARTPLLRTLLDAARAAERAEPRDIDEARRTRDAFAKAYEEHLLAEIAGIQKTLD